MAGSTVNTMQDLIESKIRDLILDDVAPAWTAATHYHLENVIEANGRRYLCITAGQSGATEPTWPVVRTNPLSTISDGPVDWQYAGMSPAVLRVVYRGEPHIVPVKLYPFGIVFLRRQRVARGEDNYGGETGYKYWRYEGYASIEVLYKDTSALLPDSDRKAEVQSYLDSKELTQAVIAAFESWDPDDDPVVRPDGDERTIGEFFSDDISNGIESRTDNVSNRGNVTFHLYTRENDF